MIEERQYCVDFVLDHNRCDIFTACSDDELLDAACNWEYFILIQASYISGMDESFVIYCLSRLFLVFEVAHKGISAS